MTGVAPLDNFPVLRTFDIEEARDAFERIYAKPALAMPGPAAGFRASLNECRLQRVRLSYGRFGAPFSFEFPAADYFWQMVALRGEAVVVTNDAEIQLCEGETATISPQTAMRVAYGADYECLVLKIDQQALTNKLVALTGVTVGAPLHVESEFAAELPAAKILAKYLPLLVNSIGCSIAPLPGWWINQTEQLLMTMFLCAHRHNYSALLHDDAAEAAGLQVRRVEDHIKTNWQKPIRLADLAEVSGVSPFSLCRSFKKVRGYSPFEFANRVRAKQGAEP